MLVLNLDGTLQMTVVAFTHKGLIPGKPRTPVRFLLSSLFKLSHGLIAIEYSSANVDNELGDLMIELE